MKNLVKVVFAILLAVTIAYTAYFVYSAFCYNQSLEEMPTTDPNLGQIIYDFPKDFLTTTEGSQLFLLGVPSIVVTWGVTVSCYWYFKASNKRTTINSVISIGCLLLLSLCLISASSLQQVASNPTTTEYSTTSAYSIVIDVLCAGDEEFMSNPDNDGYAEDAIQKANSFTSWAVYDCFEITFDIHFAVRGWKTWDSADDIHNPIEMALEVWTETGFEDGMEYNGYIIDMLCAFTGQEIDGYYAVCFPDANITLIEEWVANHGTIRHEFSHQFWAPECGGFCVMNGNYINNPGSNKFNWCNDCEDWINAHKHKWPNDVTVTVEASEHGYTSPGAGTYPARNGTTFTVSAFPDEGYLFDHWSVYKDGTFESSPTENPLSIKLTVQYEITAYFKAKPSDTSSGIKASGSEPALHDAW